MEIKTPISNVSQEKLKPCGLFRAIPVRIQTQTRNVRFTFVSVNSEHMQAFRSNVLLQ